MPGSAAVQTCHGSGAAGDSQGIELLTRARFDHAVEFFEIEARVLPEIREIEGLEQASIFDAALRAVGSVAMTASSKAGQVSILISPSLVTSRAISAVLTTSEGRGATRERTMACLLSAVLLIMGDPF